MSQRGRQEAAGGRKNGVRVTGIVGLQGRFAAEILVQHKHNIKHQPQERKFQYS